MALNENIVREQDARISKMIHTPTFLVVAGACPPCTPPPRWRTALLSAS